MKDGTILLEINFLIKSNGFLSGKQIRKKQKTIKEDRFYFG